MKPFLILQLRPKDKPADGEFEAILRFGGLEEPEAHRIRTTKGNLPDIDLDNYSGVIVGGGPFNLSDPESKKSDAQVRSEEYIFGILEEVVRKDFPYLGACSGLAFLAECCGAEVSKGRYSEPVGGMDVELTDVGREDPLFAGLPDKFRVLGGHKESCQSLPSGAVLLATSEACLVQAMRVGENVYGVQFHTELDIEGIIVRIKTYKHEGYFPPEDADELIEAVQHEKISVPMEILKRFVQKYGQAVISNE